MVLNLQHLRAFHVVASEGSISRAARRLQVAQPTLSQQIRALELRHQVVLFESRKPPLRLTRAGEDLLALTRRLFAVTQDIEISLSGVAQGIGGTVRLGSDSPVYAARLVAKFTAQAPEAVVRVRMGNAEEVLQWLRNAEIDAAICSDPSADPMFHYEPLYRDQLAVALPAEHRLASSEPIPLAALAGETILAREPMSRTRKATEALFIAAGVAPGAILEMHTREAIREAVALGLGIGFFYSTQCPPDPRIAYRGITAATPVPTVQSFLVVVAEHGRNPTLRKLLAIGDDLKRMSPLGLGD